MLPKHTIPEESIGMQVEDKVTLSGAGETEVSEQLAEYLEKIREGIRLQGLRLSEQKLEDSDGLEKKDGHRDLAVNLEGRGNSKRKSILSGLTEKSTDAVSDARAKGMRFCIRLSSIVQRRENPSPASPTGKRSGRFSSRSLHAAALDADAGGQEPLFKTSEADDGGEDIALLSTTSSTASSPLRPYRGQGRSQFQISLDLAREVAAKHVGHVKNAAKHLLRMRRREVGWSKIDG